MTERAELIDALNAAFEQKYHSMAQYVVGAEPFVAPGREKLLAVIRDIARMDQGAAAQLGQAIEDLGGIAQAGTLDPQLSAYNYLDLDFLANALLDTLDRQRNYYLGMRQRFGGDPDADLSFAMLCSVTTEQLSRLRAAM